MTPRAFRVSAIVLGAAAFAFLSPLSAASAATVVHHPAHDVHRPVAHVYGRLHATRSVHHHYARGSTHRYAYGYGYDPGAAAAAGVIGGLLGAGVAGAYDCGYGYGSCDDYGYGYGPFDGGYGYGYGPGLGFGYGGYGRGFNGNGFHGHFAGGNFGHMGGFGGGHFGGGGRFR